MMGITKEVEVGLEVSRCFWIMILDFGLWLFKKVEQSQAVLKNDMSQ